MEYLIKVSAILILFYTCYKLFLNRETFFESNRSFLLLGLITAFVLPLIVIPKYIEFEPTVMEGAMMYGNNISQPIAVDNSINVISMLTYIYLAGVLFFSGRFLFQFWSLVLLFINSTKQRVETFIYVITKKALSPFSFFNWIVFNPNHFNNTELEQIITHEKIHAQQLHSADILLVELTSILLWFNPFIWFYKKDLRQNLEFIADKNAQAITNCKKSYQHLLLKTSVPNYQMALTNNFYNSLIKKRIVMLHKNKSNNRNQLKFLFILPALVIFLMSFNTKEIYVDIETNSNNSSAVLDLNGFEEDIDSNVESKLPLASQNIVNNSKPLKTTTDTKQDIVTYFIESSFTDTQLDNVKAKLKGHGVTIKFKGVKRNDDNEITALKIDAKSNKSNANFSIDNDTAIKTIRITFNAKDNSISIGNSNNLLHDKDYEFMHKDGTVTIKKSGKGNNVFVYSSDEEHDHENEDEHEDEHEIIEEDGKIIIKSKGTVHELKKAHKDKNVFIISDGDKVIDLKGDTVKEGNYIIKKDKKGKTIKEWKDKDGNIFIHSDDNNDGLFIEDGDNEVKIKSSGNALWIDDEEENISIQTIGKEKNKLFISTDGDKQPLFIVDGKEGTKKDLDVDPNNIESVNVLKGEAAIKKYGDKGKDGVIEITTKKKKD